MKAFDNFPWWTSTSRPAYPPIAALHPSEVTRENVAALSKAGYVVITLHNPAKGVVVHSVPNESETP